MLNRRLMVVAPRQPEETSLLSFAAQATPQWPYTNHGPRRLYLPHEDIAVLGQCLWGPSGQRWGAPCTLFADSVLPNSSNVPRIGE